MTHTTLNEILAAKEQRVLRRSSLQAEYPGVCVSLSLNIPGPKKDSPPIRSLFRHAASCIESSCTVVASITSLDHTGPHAVFAVKGEATAIKAVACRLETESDYGRLWDIDVYDATGSAVASPERGSGRTCFVCGELAALCMRKQSHSVPEIMAAAGALFSSFHAAMSRSISVQAARYAALGLEAVLYEAAAGPAPGLVDPFHTGSHNDMDFFTFQRSSAALAFGFARCVEAGIRHDGEAENLLPVLRSIGLEAEKDMLLATNGINTQKGLLFSMGLALGAAGLLIRDEIPVEPDGLCPVLQRMTAGLVARELGGSTARTAGERVFRNFGIAGVRGEMEAGLPSVREAGLPVLEQALARGEDCNRALIRALIALIAVVDDTTILARSPELESLRMVQAKAREIQESGCLDSDAWQEAVWRMDAELVQRNLSPGGSADLLALTWFFHRCRQKAESA
jgi:holo-ACP synthase CitX